MLIVFTDLDGCLLDHDTYDWKPAEPALDALRQRHAPVILTTSKTRAEVEELQRSMALNSPSIVENGGAILHHVAQTPEILGWPRGQVIQTLAQVARQAGMWVRGFSQMTEQEIAERCGFSVDQARQANAREYSEPFVFVESPEASPSVQPFVPHQDRIDTFKTTAAEFGLHIVRGGRFFHAQHQVGKEAAVARIIDATRQHAARAGDQAVVTIGLGDGLNDEGFLRLVDHAVILDSAHADQLEWRLPKARRTPRPGPAAWAAAVLALLEQLG